MKNYWQLLKMHDGSKLLVMLGKLMIAGQYWLLLLTLSVVAARANATQLDEQVVSRFKSYLSAIKSIEVDFYQSDSNHVTARGKLLISKPHKFRCNYYPAFPLVIIGNKNYVVVYDYDMQQTSRTQSQENIFNFLLADQINFQQHFQVEAATEQGNTLKVALRHRLTDQLSQITFNQTTKQIKTIEIFEDNKVITVAFGLARNVVSFDQDLFIIRSPDVFGPPARFTKAQIEKKYVLAK